MEAGLSLSASELCWGPERGVCLVIQLEKLCSSSCFPTICLEGPSTAENPQLRQAGNPQKTREIHQRALPALSVLLFPCKPNLLWHLGLEISILALGKCNFCED